MKRKLATTLVVSTALVLSMLATFSAARPAAAAYDDPDDPKTVFPIDGVPTSFNDNVVVKWNDELLQTIRANPPTTGPTVTARAIAVLHTAIYDAWAAYDGVADGVHYQQKPDTQRTAANKEKAISFAAHKTLSWLFPARADLGEYDAQMQELNYVLTDASLPATVGRDAAQATIDYRGNDNSNQANGYAAPPGYYTPANTPDQIIVPWRWQPLCVLTAAGVAAGKPHLPPPGQTCASDTTNYTAQKPYTPHWKDVKAFALDAAHQYTPPGPPKLADGSYDPKDVTTALQDTANLDDTEKVIAEYWADGPKSEFPPGHWALLGQAYSRKRVHSVDTDVKLFFTMGNALLDASISSWAAKYDLRLLAADQRHPPSPQGQAGQLLARPLQGLRHGRRQPVAALPGAHRGHPAVPRVHLRALDLQRRRPHHPHRLHRQRHLRWAGDHQGRHLPVRAKDRTLASRPVTWS